MPIGPTELIIVLVLVLIVFGAGKLPEVGSALGKGIKEFRKAKEEVTEIETSIKSDLTLDAKPKPAADRAVAEQPRTAAADGVAEEQPESTKTSA